MRNKKFIVFLVAMMMLLANVIVEAKPMKHMKSPIFMGEILEVEKDKDGKSVKLTVEGYIKNCEVYKEKLIVTVNPETKLVKGCEGEVKTIEFNKGDNVFIVLNEAMTKSIPPQVNAKMIKVTAKK